MSDDGCCTACGGIGVGGPASGPETNGRCADCLGQGCAHEGDCTPQIGTSPCTCVCIAPMRREFGSGVPIAPAEWEQGDDCPVHPRLSFCPECGDTQVQLETSEETSGAMEAERHWLVTRLACGHSDAMELRPSTISDFGFHASEGYR